jgi:membrane protein
MTLKSLQLAIADIVSVTRRAFIEFGQDQMAQRSAALAYYAVFSIFPLLLLAISLIGFMLEFGVPVAMDAQTIVLDGVDQALPEAKELVQQIILTTRRTRGGIGLVGLIVLAWSASNVFTQIRLALNEVWDVGLPQGLGGLLRLRLRALGMAFSTGFLLFIATLSDTILELIARYVTRLPLSDLLWLLGRPVLLAGMTTVLFAVIYRFLPRATLSWADVWPGAIVAAVGWEMLKRGFVLYTTTVADWSAVYGSIGSVIGLLLWLYLAAQLLLFGAEFSAAYSRLLLENQFAVTEPNETVQVATEGGYEEVATGKKAEPSVESGFDQDDKVVHVGLARGTAVGLIGAGAAAGVAIVGLLATGWRIVSRRSDTDDDGETA